jgi:hypothetical protein
MHQQSRNVSKDTQGDDASIAKENESNKQELTHTYTYLWKGSQKESIGRGCMCMRKWDEIGRSGKVNQIRT